MTIFEYIRQQELAHHSRRLKILLEVDAPECVIKPFRKKVTDLQTLTIEKVKNGKLANIELNDIRELKGTKGKPYYICNDSVIAFTNLGIAFKKKEY